MGKKYVPAEIGCSVYRTSGESITRTRDGALRVRILDREGTPLSDAALENENGESAPVEIPQKAAAVEFSLWTGPNWPKDEEGDTAS